jgi:hypothetical protein
MYSFSNRIEKWVFLVGNAIHIEKIGLIDGGMIDNLVI